MAAILATSYPNKTPELMAYLRTIVRAHRSFSGEGWVTYDTCFRRKAAARKSLDWGQVDFTLYNETFTGRTKSIPRCKFCMSEHHSSTECIFTASDPSKRMLPPANTYYTDGNKPFDHLCHLYNSKLGNRCHFNPCKFTHSCVECGNNHPASQCKGSRTGGRPSNMGAYRKK